MITFITDEEAGLRLGACWVLSLLRQLGHPILLSLGSVFSYECLDGSERLSDLLGVT